MDKYDVIIIGAGAAGMAAAIYTCRKQLKTLVISVDIGGQTILTSHIENYPGFTKETPGYAEGPKLMSLFQEQAISYGAQFIAGKASKVDKTEGGFKIALTNGEEYETRALILAYGKVPRSLGIPGEDKFIGRGVSTCATCDAPVFKNKTVAVVGGGNSAIEAAELLTKFATKVYVVHRRDAFRADEITIEKVKKSDKIEFVLNSAPVEIKGDKFVSAVVVEDVNTKARKELPINGLFVEIGYVVESDFVKHLVKVDAMNEVEINMAAETACPGIFAAGDVTNVPYKQTGISAGWGATAGLSAYNYLMKLEGKTGAKVDWG